jgi:hypothetical protein
MMGKRRLVVELIDSFKYMIPLPILIYPFIFQGTFLFPNHFTPSIPQNECVFQANLALLVIDHYFSDRKIL